MFLGVSTITERGRSGQLVDDRVEMCYFQHVLGAIQKLAPKLQMVLFTDAETHDAFPGFVRVRVEDGPLNLLGGKGKRLAQTARQCGVDTVLAPLSCPLPPHSSYAQMLFVTDLVFLGPTTGRDAAKTERVARGLRGLLRECQGLVCTSHALQKLCTARLGLGMERIYVAQPGVSEIFTKTLAPVAQAPYGVLPLNRYTFPCLPALREAMKKRPELFPPTMVIVGPMRPDEPHDWTCGTIRVEQCPDNIMASLLRHADILLYPALEDGCGMAVVEALRAGTPVLTARAGAPAEWGGNVPAYCEPENPTSIIQALRRFQDETRSEREDRLAMGRGAASEATWERCAWKILAALKRT